MRSAVGGGGGNMSPCWRLEVIEVITLSWLRSTGGDVLNSISGDILPSGIAHCEAAGKYDEHRCIVGMWVCGRVGVRSNCNIVNTFLINK